MNNIAIIGIVGLAGGLAIGLQAPLASIIGQRLGMIESVFIIHLGGMLAALLILLFNKGAILPNGRMFPGMHFWEAY